MSVVFGPELRNSNFGTRRRAFYCINFHHLHITWNKKSGEWVWLPEHIIQKLASMHSLRLQMLQRWKVWGHKILLNPIYLIQSSKAIQEINKQQPSKNSIGFISTTYISRWDLCFLEVEGMHSRNTPRHWWKFRVTGPAQYSVFTRDPNSNFLF